MSEVRLCVLASGALQLLCNHGGDDLGPLRDPAGRPDRPRCSPRAHVHRKIKAFVFSLISLPRLMFTRLRRLRFLVGPPRSLSGDLPPPGGGSAQLQPADANSLNLQTGGFSSGWGFRGGAQSLS